MSASGDDWRDAHALLLRRLGEIPAALARTAERVQAPLALGAPPRRVIATGVGSSEAHAALLAWRLRDAGLDAAAEPLSCFLAPRAPRPDDVLAVFSQGLSPNAYLALAAPDRWRRVVLVTAVTDPARLGPLRDRGVVVHTIDGENEMGTLVRVVGPMTGAVAALGLAHALGAPPAPPIEPVLDALRTLVAPALASESLEAPLALITTGTYGALALNLQYKIMEATWLPMPPVWDALHLAHGPFQQRFRDRATFLALTRPDAAGEEELLDRFARMLDPARHLLVRLHASLPAPLALFEHEAVLNALVLRYIEARRLDQARWPGRGADAPLYGLAAQETERRLARLVWEEIDARRPATAIVPLGATEQHGPHLPFSTDTVIADALATRLAARLGNAIALPALPIGCSSEHLGFPGTLDLSSDTLVALLRDVLGALARHGIAQAFVFSAHGGNAATLARASTALASAAPGLDVVVSADLSALTARLHTEAARLGVGPEAAGHHAGEIETSIMLALRPELVRSGALAPGHTAATPDPQALFYPDLRRTVPAGVVGDPCTASAARGVRYLAAWVDVLEASLHDAKKST